MSPSSASSSAKTLSVSYADRAKKAQSVKPNSPVTVHSSPSNPATVANPHPLPNAIAPSLTPNPAPNHDTSPSSAILANQESNPGLLSIPPEIKTVNGDSRASGDPLSSAVATYSPSQKLLPTVNFWNARKIAQAQSQAKTPSSPGSSQNLPQVLPPKTSLLAGTQHAPSDPDSLSAPFRSSETRPNGTHRQQRRISLTGLSAAALDVDDDPFVVRLPAQQPRGLSPSLPPPPSIDDAESWPEVGKSSSAGTIFHQNTSQAEIPQDGNGEGEDHASSQVSGAPARKSEKTKWIAIPAEELQAAADALQASTRQPHSRNHWPHNYSGHKHSRNNQSSGSGSAQGPSRSHSGRNSMSHSVSQSQAHSRTGSVHSSPRHAGRGKRLPSEERAGGGAHIEVITPAVIVKPSDNPPQPPGDLGMSVGSTYVPRVQKPAMQESLNLQQPLTSHNLSGVPGLNSVPPHGPVPPMHPRLGLPTYPIYPPYRAFEQGQSFTQYEQRSPVYPPILPSFPSQLDEQRQPAGTITSPISLVSPTVAGYMASGVSPGGDSRHLDRAVDDHDKRTPPVVFGSIGIPGSSKGPGPTAHDAERDDTTNELGSVEKKNKTFSVGLCPGEPGPSRVRVSKGRKRPETASTGSMSDLTSSCVSDVDLVVGKEKEERSDNSKIDGNVIDLTRLETETKWEFGTVESSEGVFIENGPLPQIPTLSPQLADAPPIEQLSSTPVDTPNSRIQTSGMDLQHGEQLASPLSVLPMAPPFPHQRTSVPPLATDANAAGVGNEWEVKNYGYGFGHGGVGHTPSVAHEGVERDREWVDVERERERQRDQEREREYNGRPRRGSYGGGYGYERGGYGGRRARGVNSGFPGGRGYYRGGRGTYQSQQRPPPPFTITSPVQPLSTHADPAATYYPPPPRPLTTYIPTGFESYSIPAPVRAPLANAPPVPVPLSVLSFPLDPTRWYLLGQLEYYLSPQNMAQDFFLRQKMDSRGWISIPLISSFNRVRQLTVDPSLVREVLVLSSVVEVREDWVRMNGWEQFVLPNAPKSQVEGVEVEKSGGLDLTDKEKVRAEVVGAESRDAEGENEDCEGECEGDGEEEEEEEVVFVMERM